MGREIEEEEEFDFEIEEDIKDLFVDPNTNTYSYSNAVKKEFDSIFPTKYKEFTEEDYKTLYNNLLVYKQGNLEAAQYIISVFHRFLKKYVDFICYGSVTEINTKQYRKQYDKSLTKFIGLFISKEKRLLVANTLDKNRLFSETCAKIKLLFSKYEYWDVYNELACALLNMANKYKITQEGDEYHKENGTFHMYVSKCFHFDAYNTLSKIISDPLAHFEMYGLTDENNEMKDIRNRENMKRGTRTIILKDTETESEIEHMMVKADRKKLLLDSERLILNETEQENDPYEMESLNFNWTNGSTCGEMFKELTAYEREILVLSFAQNKTDSEIANLYGCHRITIIKHKKIAVEKIKKGINPEK